MQSECRRLDTEVPMDNSHNDEISTPRLCLRRISRSDLDSYHEIMRKQEVCQWLAGPARKTPSETQQLIDKLANHWREKGYGVWGVFINDGGLLIGHCGLAYLQETGETELQYAFDPEYWGYGYATESAMEALKWAFAKTGQERIIALAMPDNKRSIGVLEKLGFRPLGMKRYFGTGLLCFEIFRDSVPGATLD